jgi:hypothetical protein
MFRSGRAGRRQPLTPVGLGVWGKGCSLFPHKKTVQPLAATGLRPEAALNCCAVGVSRPAISPDEPLGLRPYRHMMQGVERYFVFMGARAMVVLESGRWHV